MLLSVLICVAGPVYVYMCGVYASWEHMLVSATGWAQWHGAVAALPLVSYQILQLPKRYSSRKEPWY